MQPVDPEVHVFAMSSVSSAQDIDDFFRSSRRGLEATSHQRVHLDLSERPLGGPSSWLSIVCFFGASLARHVADHPNVTLSVDVSGSPRNTTDRLSARWRRLISRLQVLQFVEAIPRVSIEEIRQDGYLRQRRGSVDFAVYPVFPLSLICGDTMTVEVFVDTVTGNDKRVPQHYRLSADLRKQFDGFLAANQVRESRIDTVLRHFVDELASNVMLHSVPEGGTPIGAMGAWFDGPRRSGRRHLRVCISDAGIGLRGSLALGNADEQAEVEALVGVCAGTRARAQVGSEWRHYYKHGIEHIIALLGQDEECGISTGGVGIRATGAGISPPVRDAIAAGFRAELSLAARSYATQPATPPELGAASIQLSQFRDLSESNGSNSVQSAEGAESAQGPCLGVVDLGFRQLSPERFAQAIAELSNHDGVDALVLMNAPVTEADLARVRLSAWPAHLPLVVVKNLTTAWLTSTRLHTQEEGELSLDALLTPLKGEPIRRNVASVHLRPADYLSLLQTTNSWRIAAGMRAEEPERIAGLYGEHFPVRLPDGDTVTFVSITDLCEHDEAENERWVNTALALIMLAIGGRASIALEEEHLIVGFTASVEAVLAQAVRRLPFRTLVFILEDVSERAVDALRSQVGEARSLLLCTDVIATRTSADAVRELLRQSALRVSAELTLVRAAQAVPEDAGNAAPLALAGALFQRRVVTRAAPYELDVATNRAVPATGADPLVVERITKTLALLAEHPSCVSLGHQIVGHRHATAVVRVDELLRAAPSRVSALLAEAFVAAEESRARAIAQFGARNNAWGSFRPAAVLLTREAGGLRSAAGTARGSSTPNGARDLTRAALTAIGCREEELQQIPIVAVRRDDVRAGFSPGRQALATQELARYLARQNKEVLIVDDGLWTGRTSRALLDIAMRAGASAVLIMPILARCSAADARYWESQSEYYDAKSARRVPVLWVFGLHLPLVSWVEGDCAFERLLRKAKLLPVSFLNGGEAAILEIIAHYSPEAIASRLASRRAHGIAASVWLNLLAEGVEWLSISVDALRALPDEVVEEAMLLHSQLVRSPVVHATVYRDLVGRLGAPHRLAPRASERALALLRLGEHASFVAGLTSLAEETEQQVPFGDFSLIAVHALTLPLGSAARARAAEELVQIGRRMLALQDATVFPPAATRLVDVLEKVASERELPSRGPLLLYELIRAATELKGAAERDAGAQIPQLPGQIHRTVTMATECLQWQARLSALHAIDPPNHDAIRVALDALDRASRTIQQVVIQYEEKQVSPTTLAEIGAVLRSTMSVFCAQGESALGSLRASPLAALLSPLAPYSVTMPTVSSLQEAVAVTAANAAAALQARLAFLGRAALGVSSGDAQPIAIRLEWQATGDVGQAHLAIAVNSPTRAFRANLRELAEHFAPSLALLSGSARCWVGGPERSTVLSVTLPILRWNHPAVGLLKTEEGI